MDEIADNPEWRPEPTEWDVQEQLVKAAISCASPGLIIAKLIADAQAMIDNSRWN
jgi:hypothetical protein